MAALNGSPIFNVLAAGVVERTAVTPDKTFALPGGLRAELFSVPGKAALYLEGDDPVVDAETGANVGIEIQFAARRLLYIPGASGITPAMLDRCRHADVILFDGTLFVDDEMISNGTGSKTGRRMGHMPIAGADGTLAALRDLKRGAS